MAQTYLELVDQLVKNGLPVSKAVVKNAEVDVLATWSRVRITLDTEVDGYERQEDGTYKRDKTKVIFVSAFSVINVLRADDESDAADAIPHLKKHTTAIGPVLKGAKLTLVRQDVKEGDTDAEGNVVDHDTIFWYIKDIELSDKGNRRIEQIINSLMGL